MSKKHIARLSFHLLAHLGATLAICGLTLVFWFILSGVFAGLYNYRRGDDGLDWGLIIISLGITSVAVLGTSFLRLDAKHGQQPLAGAILCGLTAGAGFSVPAHSIVYWLPTGILLLIGSATGLISGVGLKILDERFANADKKNAIGQLITPKMSSDIARVGRFSALGAVVLTILLMARNPLTGNFNLGILGREWNTLFFGQWFPLLVVIVLGLLGAKFVTYVKQSFGNILLLTAFVAFFYLPIESMILNWLPAIVLQIISICAGLLAFDSFDWQTSSDQKAQPMRETEQVE